MIDDVTRLSSPSLTARQCPGGREPRVSEGLAQLVKALLSRGALPCFVMLQKYIFIFESDNKD